jgi:hypothetical protein
MLNREKQLEELFLRRKTEIRHGRLVVPIPNASKCAYNKCAMCAYNKNSSINIGGLSETEQLSLVKQYLLDAEKIIKNKLFQLICIVQALFYPRQKYIPVY